MFTYSFAVFLDGGVKWGSRALVKRIQTELSFILVLQREGVMRFRQEASDCCEETPEKFIMSQV